MPPRESAYTVERRGGAADPPRPRLGGSVVLPASGALAELFVASIDDLPAAERSGSAWCIRVGVPPDDAIPPGLDFDLHELILEITLSSGGSVFVIQANAYPGAVVNLVGEQISARLVWGVTPVSVPPVTLRWQLASGHSRSTAQRAFTVQSVAVGRVPTFATQFALFSGAAAVTEAIAIDFAVHASSSRVIQHYTQTDLLGIFAAFTPLPPGASEWRWLTQTALPLRLVFALGGGAA